MEEEKLPHKRRINPQKNSTEDEVKERLKLRYQLLFEEIDQEARLTDLQKRLLKSLFLNRGLVSIAAQAAGCSRGAHTLAVQQNETYKKYYEMVKEDLLDTAEDNLFHLIDKKNPFILTWYLERQGKSRGYSSSNDVNLSLNSPIKFEVNFNGPDKSEPEDE